MPTRRARSVVRSVLGYSRWLVWLAFGGAFTPLSAQPGSLSGAVLDTLRTLSRVPPSWLAPPWAMKKFPLPVHGAEVVRQGGRDFYRIELRGWLRGVADHCNSNEPEFPDWHYELEIDPQWLDSIGVNVHEVIRPGNLIHFPLDRDGHGSFKRLIVTPMVHVELIGWDESKYHHTGPNPYWSVRYLPGPGCPAIDWPFDPRNPIPSDQSQDPLQFQPSLKDSQYVRVYGSILTDDPHSEEDAAFTLMCRFGFGCPGESDQNVVKKVWAAGHDYDDPKNLTRWTEIHPPDIIVVLHKDKKETVRGIVVTSPSCLFFCSAEGVRLLVTPPVTRPSPKHHILVREFIGPGTIPTTITLGDPVTHGANIYINPSNPVEALIEVAVKGERRYQSPGKFEAIYRVSWTDAPMPQSRCGQPRPPRYCDKDRPCGRPGYPPCF